MKKKYQVFVSSTYEDLKEERLEVIRCLLDNDCIPVGMEQFPASPMTQMEYIEKMLDDCDYYILILAGRYGSLDSDGVGFTEKEYDYAVSKGIPVLVFMIDNIGNIPSKYCDDDPEKKSKLIEFRERIKSGSNSKLVKFYSDKGSLTTQVVTSIHKCIQDFPAVGWVRANEIETYSKDMETRLREIVNEELHEHTASEDDITEIFNKIFERRKKEYPTIFYGKEPPENAKDGDIFFKIED